MAGRLASPVIVNRSTLAVCNEKPSSPPAAGPLVLK
jgi:hypothetical protein